MSTASVPVASTSAAAVEDANDGDEGARGRRVHFDRRRQALAIRVDQADFYVSAQPNEYLSTVLGSCIAVCMRDPEVLCGGMSHFALPEDTGVLEPLPGLQLRYGAYAIERLINALAARGALRKRLEVKVFGGANVIASGTPIGFRNAEFVERYFAREGIPIAASHMRGHSGRKVLYFPATGKALVRLLTPDAVPRLARHESEIERKVREMPAAGMTTIFR